MKFSYLGGQYFRNNIASTQTINILACTQWVGGIGLHLCVKYFEEENCLLWPCFYSAFLLLLLAYVEATGVHATVEKNKRKNPGFTSVSRFCCCHISLFPTLLPDFSLKIFLQPQTKHLTTVSLLSGNLWPRSGGKLSCYCVFSIHSVNNYYDQQCMIRNAVPFNNPFQPNSCIFIFVHHETHCLCLTHHK